MSTSRNINNELIDLRQEVMACFQNILPDKQFQAQMILALIGLHLVVKQIQSSRDLEVRRKLLRNFERYKKAIAKNLDLLKQNIKRINKAGVSSGDAQETRVCSKFDAQKPSQNSAGRGSF